MFDPYHKWLGIPKSERPPSHYRLLGIEPTEQDREVIEEAAIRQIGHVRSYQTGPFAAECTHLLNEVAHARGVLLDPVKRKQYDQELAHRMKRPASGAESPVAPQATPRSSGFHVCEESPLLLRVAKRHSRDARPMTMGLSIGAAVGVVALIGIGFWLVPLLGKQHPERPPNDPKNGKPFAQDTLHSAVPSAERLGPKTDRDVEPKPAPFSEDTRAKDIGSYGGGQTTGKVEPKTDPPEAPPEKLEPPPAAKVEIPEPPKLSKVPPPDETADPVSAMYSATIFMVNGEPEKYEGKTVLFDKAVLRGGTIRTRDQYAMHVGNEKAATPDDLTFSLSKKLANKLVEEGRLPENQPVHL